MAIFRGVSQEVGPLRLSDVHEIAPGLPASARCRRCSAIGWSTPFRHGPVRRRADRRRSAPEACRAHVPTVTPDTHPEPDRQRRTSGPGLDSPARHPAPSSTALPPDPTPVTPTPSPGRVTDPGRPRLRRRPSSRAHCPPHRRATQDSSARTRRDRRPHPGSPPGPRYRARAAGLRRRHRHDGLCRCRPRRPRPGTPERDGLPRRALRARRDRPHRRPPLGAVRRSGDPARWSSHSTAWAWP